MNIAIDISPIRPGSQHKVRGTGFYLEHIKKALVERYPDERFTFFADEREIPEDTDIVHYPYFEPFFITLPLKKRFPTVVTVHDLTPLVFPEHFPSGIKGGMKWAIQRFLLGKVDGIVTDSFCSQHDIARITKRDSATIAVAHLAAGEEFTTKSNKEHLQAVRKKYHLPEKFVLYVGDITWNKNVPNLVEALIQVHIPLVLVGKAIAAEDYDQTNAWNKDLHSVKAMTKNNSLVSVLGYVPKDDLVSLYHLATLFAFPSRYEGFGLPVIEAMASGTPVVTSAAGSLKEVGGDAVYYVEPNNVASIAQGIREVFTSTSLQKSLSAKGIEQAAQFTWQKTAEATFAVYKRVLNT